MAAYLEFPLRWLFAKAQKGPASLRGKLWPDKQLATAFMQGREKATD
jgi:hypothetical protein